MSNIGKPERATQNRVIDLFRDELHYQYLGDKSEQSNSNIEDGLLTKYLKSAEYSDAQISSAIYLLKTEANNRSFGHQSLNLTGGKGVNGFLLKFIIISAVNFYGTRNQLLK